MLLVEFLCSDAMPVHGDTARNSQIYKLLNWVLNWQLGTELDLTQSGVSAAILAVLSWRSAVANKLQICGWCSMVCSSLIHPIHTGALDDERHMGFDCPFQHLRAQHCHLLGNQTCRVAAPQWGLADCPSYMVVSIQRNGQRLLTLKLL